MVICHSSHRKLIHFDINRAQQGSGPPLPPGMNRVKQGGRTWGSPALCFPIPSPGVSRTQWEAESASVLSSKKGWANQCPLSPGRGAELQWVSQCSTFARVVKAGLREAEHTHPPNSPATPQLGGYPLRLKVKQNPESFRKGRTSEWVKIQVKM